jgi:hypothetical protein
MQDKRKMISEGMRRQEKKMENTIDHEGKKGLDDRMGYEEKNMEKRIGDQGERIPI